jgi:hypothetical protein
MIEVTERKMERFHRQFDEAAESMQKAVVEAGLRAATHVYMVETGATSEHAARAQIKEHGTLRQILTASGQLVTSVARSTIAEPFAPGAWDHATFTLAKLLVLARMAAGR